MNLRWHFKSENSDSENIKDTEIIYEEMLFCWLNREDSQIFCCFSETGIKIKKTGLRS